MEHVRCDFCGADDPRVLFRGRDRMFPSYRHEHAVVQCTQCGLYYLDPRPTTVEEVLEGYPPEYDSYTDVDRKWLLRLRLLAWRGELRSMVPFAGPGKRVFEVGCATGEYLAAFRDMTGSDVIGVEYNPGAADLARKRHGLDVVSGDVFAAGLPDASVDVLIMRFVLEHVGNPMAVLREVARVLRPGGVFYCAIPNPESLDAKVFGNEWYAHEIPRHLHNYPLATLRRMYAAVGLEADRVDHSYVPNDWILGIHYKLMGDGPPGWLARQFAVDKPLAILLCAPLGVMSGLFRCAGRVRVRARRVGPAPAGA